MGVSSLAFIPQCKYACEHIVEVCINSAFRCKLCEQHLVVKARMQFSKFPKRTLVDDAWSMCCRYG